MYLTYNEYTVLGGTLDEATFNLLEMQAETEIDWYTFNRLWDDDTVSDRVKQCMYLIINLIREKQIASAIPLQDGSTLSGLTAGIASQSNDGVSISYNVISAKDVVDQNKSEIEGIIQKYLNGAVNSLGRKILYRGIYPGE